MSNIIKFWGDGPPDSPARPGVAVTGTNTYYSQAIRVNHGVTASFHITFTGTMTGTLTIWFSNIPNAALDTDADWVEDSTATLTSPAGSATKDVYNIGNLAVYGVRFKYVNASGSGTVRGWAQTPAVG